MVKLYVLLYLFLAFITLLLCKLLMSVRFCRMSSLVMNPATSAVMPLTIIIIRLGKGEQTR